MSNIHRLSDYAPQRDYSASGLPGPGGASPRPEDVSCVEMFFPGFRVKSFILWVSIVEIIVYIATLIVGSQGLRPNGNTLHKFGDSYGPSIQNDYQIWRFVTPIFLHGSIWHILFNVFFQMRMGFPLESQYGLWRVSVLYFVSGIAGNIFSLAIAPCKDAVGASTAGFGLIGIQMAEMALSWHLLRNRDQATFNIVLFIVLSVVLSISPGSTVDWRGHVGGFIAGFCLGIPFNQQMDSKPRWYQTAWYSSIATIVVLYVVGLAIIFAIPMTGPGGRCV